MNPLLISWAIKIASLVAFITAVYLAGYRTAHKSVTKACEADKTALQLAEANAREAALKQSTETINLLKSSASALEQQVLERDEQLEQASKSDTVTNANSLRVVYKRARNCGGLPKASGSAALDPVPESPADWQLWQRASDNLTAMATRADKLAEQLNACQSFIEAERK